MEKDDKPEFADDASFFSHLNMVHDRKTKERERSVTTVVKKK